MKKPPKSSARNTTKPCLQCEFLSAENIGLQKAVDQLSVGLGKSQTMNEFLKGKIFKLGQENAVLFRLNLDLRLKLDAQASALLEKDGLLDLNAELRSELKAERERVVELEKKNSDLAGIVGSYWPSSHKEETQTKEE